MDALTAVYLFAYGAAVALYLAYHVGLREPLARMGRVALAVGWVLETVEIGIRCVRGQHPASSIAEAMAFIGWLIAGGFLLAAWRYRLNAAGAFAAPAALVLVLLARVVPAGEAAPPGALGLFHIFLATSGVATFALAAILEGLYLLQERRLKRKRLDRLPAGGSGTPLDTLDQLAARCVQIGFPVFTLAILTGAIWVARLGLVQGAGTVRVEYVLAVASWIAFGVLLLARVGAGWQGRRAAWLTVGGFSGVLLAVLGYFLRATV